MTCCAPVAWCRRVRQRQYRRESKQAVNRSSAKLASYLSKYIGKTFDQAEKHVSSYSASGRALPAPTMFQTVGTVSAVFDLVLDLLGPEVAASEVLYGSFGWWQGCTAAFPPERSKQP